MANFAVVCFDLAHELSRTSQVILCNWKVPHNWIGFQILAHSCKRCPMERFVHEENILRYRKLLAVETDEAKRTAIRKLLAEEEAKSVTRSPTK